MQTLIYSSAQGNAVLFELRLIQCYSYDAEHQKNNKTRRQTNKFTGQVKQPIIYFKVGTTPHANAHLLIRSGERCPVRAAQKALSAKFHLSSWFPIFQPIKPISNYPASFQLSNQFQLFSQFRKTWGNPTAEKTTCTHCTCPVWTRSQILLAQMISNYPANL